MRPASPLTGSQLIVACFSHLDVDLLGFAHIVRAFLLGATEETFDEVVREAHAAIEQAERDGIVQRIAKLEHEVLEKDRGLCPRAGEGQLVAMAIAA